MYKINLSFFAKIFTYSIMAQLDQTVKNALSFLDNEYVTVGVCAALAVYTAMVAPMVAKDLKSSFLNNEYVLLVMLVLVGLVSRKDVTVALLLAVAVLATLFFVSTASDSTGLSTSETSETSDVSYQPSSDVDADADVDQPYLASVNSTELESAGVDNAKANDSGSSGEEYEQVGNSAQPTNGLGGYTDSSSYASA